MNMSSLPSTERSLTRQKKSSALKLFAFSINFYLIYILLGFDFFLYAGHFFLAIMSIYLFIYLIKRIGKKESEYKSFMSFGDSFKLAIKYLKINKIFIIASILGLILATVVISQTVLLSASYEQQTFDEFIKDVDTTGYVFRGQQSDNNAYNAWVDHMTGFEEFLNSNGVKMDYYENLKLYFAQLALAEEVVDTESKYIRTSEIKLGEYNTDEYSFYSQFSFFNFDFNSSETILLLPSWIGKDPELSINTTLNFIMGDTSKNNASEEFDMISVMADRIIFMPDAEINNYLNKNGWQDYERLQFILLSPLDNINYIVEEYQNFSDLNPDKYSGLSTRFQTNVYISLPNLADIEIKNLIKKLERVYQEVWQWIDTYTIQGYSWVDFQSPLLSALYRYNNEVQSMNITLFFISTPLITLALFLVYFSLSLVEKRKQRLMAIMRMRGSSKEQLRILLIEEVLVSAIMAIVSGMILSIPWTAVTLQSNGLLSTSIDIVVIPTNWYWRLPLIGIILALDLNLPNIGKLIRTTVDDGESFIEDKQPFWQRAYLDLVLFILSVIFFEWIKLINVENMEFFIYIAVVLSPFMFLIFFFGAPLVVARYFSQVIDILSEKIWRKQGGLFALATRNMKKNKYSSSRLVAFLLLGMMLSYMALIVPATIDTWNTDRTSYNIGADIYIEGIDTSNATAWDAINIDGVEAYTPIIKTSIGSQYGETIRVLGVIPDTFAKAAFWKEAYADKSLDELMSALDKNDSMLLQKGLLDYYGKKTGDYYYIENANSGNRTSYRMEIKDTFTYFPNLVDSIPISDNYGYFYVQEAQMVMNYSTALEFNIQQADYGAYVKVKNNADISKVAEQLALNFKYNSSISVKNFNSELEKISNQPYLKIIVSSLNSMLVITIIASIIAVSYFSFITLAERKKEIGVFRSMGMIRRQIFMLLLIESLTLLTTAIILGGITGYMSAKNMFFFFENLVGSGGSQSIPPLTLTIPWLSIGIFTGIMILLTVISAAIPAQATSSKQTGSILRAD